MYPTQEPPTPVDGIPVIQPDKPHHWYRPRNIILGTTGTIAVIVVASVVAGGGHQATPVAKAKPQITQSVPAVAIPSVTPSATGSIESWVLSPGYDEMITVQHDVQAVGSDANAQDIPAVESDGDTLASDARIAASDPPPVGSADYTAGMTQYAQAGDAMAADDFSGATRHLDRGNVLILKVSAKLTPAGA